MKNKKLIAIFCIFVAVVLVVILSSTVFTFQNAELYFINEDGKYIEPDKTLTDTVNVKESLNGFYGDSMVFLSKEKVISQFEKSNLNVKIERVEKVFPNKLRFYATIRVPLYYINVDDVIYVCSYDGFIMQQNPKDTVSLVKVDGTFGLESKPDLGEYIGAKFSDKTKYEVIQNFFISVWLQEGFDFAGIYDLIKSVKFEETRLTCQTQRGAVFVILSPEVDLFQKITSIYGAYSTLTDKQETGTFTSSLPDENGNYTVAVK